MTSSKYIQWMVHMYQKLAEQTGFRTIAESLRSGKQLKLLQLMGNPLFSHNSGSFNWINELLEATRYEGTTGECSSAVEHSVHIGDVTGSIPVTPTTPRKYPSATIDQQRIAALRADTFFVFNTKETA